MLADADELADTLAALAARRHPDRGDRRPPTWTPRTTGRDRAPPAGDRPEDFAHDLYRLLREADAAGAAAIVVVPPPGEGIAVAVRDRLGRAAAGRRISPTAL